MEKFDVFFYEQHFKIGECGFLEGDNNVSVFESDEYYHIQIEPPFPDMVCNAKSFFADTLSLSEEGSFLKMGGARIGIWKTYDRFGSLVEEKNYEDGYEIHWEDMLSIMNRDQIDLKSIIDISRYDYTKVIVNETKSESEPLTLNDSVENEEDDELEDYVDAADDAEFDIESDNDEVGVDVENDQEFQEEETAKSQEIEMVKCWKLSLLQAGNLKVTLVYDGVTGKLMDADAKPLL